jgi:hypothetical protein
VIWRRSPQTAAAEDIEPSHAAVIRRAWQRRPLGGLMATVDVQLRPIGGLMATVDVQLRLLAGVKLREPGRISTLAVAIAPQRSPSRRNGRHRAATVAIAPQRSPSRRNGRHRAATVDTDARNGRHRAATVDADARNGPHMPGRRERPFAHQMRPHPGRRQRPEQKAGCPTYRWPSSVRRRVPKIAREAGQTCTRSRGRQCPAGAM